MRCRWRCALRSTLIIGLLFTTIRPGHPQAQAATTVVRPKAIADVLVNPGMGITTFQRFNRQAIYPGLRKLEYPAAVRRGQMMPISMWWLNAGISPVYYPYTLAVQLASEQNRVEIHTPADVRQWLPGDALFESTLYVPESAAVGKHRFRIALLDPRTGQPAIRLAIEGRKEDGWYDLGEIEVVQ
jgi:Domain of unknown function (DUF4832)